MEIFLGLLGGLALFLYGMRMMSSGLEDAMGNHMKKILEKVTAKPWLGVLTGAAITAAIQSSSATTVMAVAFVNSGMMTLNQAVWIIMGANIGTTITGQFIALDVGMLAPLIAFLGVAMVVFSKSSKINNVGKIFAGLGILFIGMGMMSDSMVPLRNSEGFVSLMTKFSNPILGILAGAIFTAIIQSSSASVGILQALAMAGVLGFDGAVFILFGQNIGTCITSIISAIGTNTSAKRTTVIHLLFNIIGTILFTFLCLVFPITNLIESLSPGNVTKQIANMHTVFNIVTTIILFPFGSYLANFAIKILPDKKEEKKDISPLSLLEDEFKRGGFKLGNIAVYTNALQNEIDKLIKLAANNTFKAYDAVLNVDTSDLNSIGTNEKNIDKLNKEISQFVSKILVRNNNKKNVHDIEQYFLISGNAERIGDHAVNIAWYADELESKALTFSETAKKEITEMQNITDQALKKILKKPSNYEQWLLDVVSIEEEIDEMTITYREKHLERMRKGKCPEEVCLLYSEILTDFERIGDHILNIAQAYAKINKNV